MMLFIVFIIALLVLLYLLLKPYYERYKIMKVITEDYLEYKKGRLRRLKKRYHKKEMKKIKRMINIITRIYSSFPLIGMIHTVAYMNLCLHNCHFYRGNVINIMYVEEMVEKHLRKWDTKRYDIMVYRLMGTKLMYDKREFISKDKYIRKIIKYMDDPWSMNPMKFL